MSLACHGVACMRGTGPRAETHTSPHCSVWMPADAWKATRKPGIGEVKKCAPTQAKCGLVGTGIQLGSVLPGSLGAEPFC